MTNGNDLIEFEQENVESLFESFTEKYSDKWKMFKTSLPEYFIEKYKEEWEKHVEEMHIDYLASQSDFLVDSEKENI